MERRLLGDMTSLESIIQIFLSDREVEGVYGDRNGFVVEFYLYIDHKNISYNYFVKVYF